METTDDAALNLEEAWSFLEATRRQWLERSWAGTFRKHLLPQLPIELLAKQFPAKGGRHYRIAPKAVKFSCWAAVNPLMPRIFIPS